MYRILNSNLLTSQYSFTFMNVLANKLFVEALGTFVFISVIFRFASKAWGAFAIGAALAAVILFGGAISGGHFNPAVSFAMFASKQINELELCGYVAMQLIGGYFAWAYYTHQVTSKQ